ncbi:TPA: hypothetical protein QDB19_004093 [Burkholderia vietnamiensis]|uniref:hypothetical protein n=1 Tax=Burkholderia cenocepacia TaxID=95486 RepID=UPI001B9F6153|nr:hypothetical protein [Burkholderia cenocepacia]MBR8475803.1 hypothetical protein [Burkholderia cenocepacia]HDR9227842.1 hypothetical protein [Burkholderia vietnamiensis]
MDKRAIKRAILGQLAAYLRREIPIDNISDADMERAEEAGRELIEEFDRRAGDAKYAPDWKD